MTDDIQDLSQVTDASSDVAMQDSGSVEQQAPAIEEKMLPQSQVNKLIAREKRETELKVKSAYEQRMAELAAQSQQQQTSSGQPLTMEQVDARIRQEAQLRAAQQNAAQIADAFEAKIKEAIRLDPDFADDYDALNIANHPELIMLTNQLENTADVLKELSQNPGKFSSVINLIEKGNRVLANRDLASLSKSITANKAALAQKKASAPLGQLKSSPTQKGDDSYSVSSFRANPKYRG